MTATAAVPVRPAEAPPRRTPTRFVVAAIALAAVVTGIVLLCLALGFPMIERDFKVYQVGASAVLHGISPFDAATNDGLEFIYSPFAALVFIPVALLNIHVAFTIWTFASMLALEASIWMVVGLVAPDSPVRRAKFTLAASALALPTAPVWIMIGNGQINILLMVLVLADMARRRGGRFQGIGVGIAAGLKLTPLIFVVYFLFTRRIRAAVVSGVTFVATVLLGFVVLPRVTGQWFGGLATDTSRMMPPDHGPWNESIRGVLGQLPGVLHASWLGVTLTIVVGIVGLAISVQASRRGMEAVGIIGCAITSLLVSPLSWPHHWVWLVPAVAAWFWWARQRQNVAHTRGAVLAWLWLVATAVLTLLDSSPVADVAVRVFTLSPAELLLLNALPVIAGLGFLVAVFGTLRRQDHELTAEPVLSGT